jgi:hypothetical protein
VRSYHKALIDGVTTCGISGAFTEGGTSLRALLGLKTPTAPQPANP